MGSCMVRGLHPTAEFFLHVLRSTYLGRLFLIANRDRVLYLSSVIWAPAVEVDSQSFFFVRSEPGIKAGGKPFESRMECYRKI